MNGCMGATPHDTKIPTYPSEKKDLSEEIMRYVHRMGNGR